ncbi:MAG: homocitrate synthase [Candidatus Marinimicrobia bacterium]|nr:homocitrate synthase [Candidatus Neomarinimicrobiota bacterium]
MITINKKIEILDSTLREGEQTPGVSFTNHQKIEIAEMLDNFGVDFLELGHPAVSPDIYKTIDTLGQLSLNAKKIVHGRLIKSDIDDAVDLGIPWIGLFFGTSREYLNDKYRLDEKKSLELIEEAIVYAKSKKLKVRFTAEDASRTDLAFLLKIGELVEKAGADRFSLADTVGILHPNKVSELVRFFLSRLKIPIHMHCHNDFGLATANALQAIVSGARCVDVTINGLGERCGLAPLAEVTAALDELYNIKHTWDLKKLNEMSLYIDQITRINKNNTRPITGEYAFSHKAGLHINAMLKNPKSYESIPPKKLNRKHEFIIDKYASRNAIRHRLDELYIEYDKVLLDNVITQIKRRPQIAKWTDKKIKELVNDLLILKNKKATSIN